MWGADDVIFVGDDWAEDHHDVFVCDVEGVPISQRRFPEGVGGMACLHELVAGVVDDPVEVVVGIETDRGLWVQALIEAGYTVYAINPRAASRYRDRHTLSAARSPMRRERRCSPSLVRTDRHNHRQVAGDSGASEGVKVLARAHQSLIWERARTTSRLRSALLEYFPAALSTFDELAGRDALGSAGQGPDPSGGQGVDVGQDPFRAAAGGRQRNIDTRAPSDRRQVCASRGSRRPPAVVAAFAATTRASVAIIGEFNAQIAALEAELTDHFEQHPDADIYLSLPGIGVVLGARVLGEFGDDPNRYADAKSRKNYAGTSPITKASGRTRRGRPLRSQPAPRRRGAPVGVLPRCQQPRRPRLLRPAPRRRRLPPQGAASAVQPARRHLSRLPRTPHPLRRPHRLGPPPENDLTTEIRPAA